MYLRKIMILCIITCILMLSGCSSIDNSMQNNTRISIVTTVFPPYDFAKHIVGETEGVSVTQILKPGMESHTFDPSPADMLSVQNCDVFIYTGGESDEWVNTILKSIENSDMIVIKMMDIVDALIEKEELHDDMHEHEYDNSLFLYDEHVWTSPINAMILVEHIADVLCDLDPSNADTYQENSRLYLSDLTALDILLKSITSTAVRDTIVFGDRFPFRYLCDAYGICYRSAFPGCATETEPSAAVMAELIDYIKQNSIPLVFTIEMSNGRVAQAIAEETDAGIAVMHSCHNRTADEYQRDVSYLELMYQNAEALSIALGSDQSKGAKTE